MNNWRLIKTKINKINLSINQLIKSIKISIDQLIYQWINQPINEAIKLSITSSQPSTNLSANQWINHLKVWGISQPIRPIINHFTNQLCHSSIKPQSRQKELRLCQVIDLFSLCVLFSHLRPCDVLMGILPLFFHKLCIHVHENKTTKKLFPRVASRDLKWENKTYKLKRSTWLWQHMIWFCWASSHPTLNNVGLQIIGKMTLLLSILLGGEVGESRVFSFKTYVLHLNFLLEVFLYYFFRIVALSNDPCALHHWGYWEDLWYPCNRRSHSHTTPN